MLVCVVLALGATMAAASIPDGLLTNFQKSPALGVNDAPEFTWVVPPCQLSSDHMQMSYRIIVTQEFGKEVVWDSGVVKSNSRCAP